MLLAHVTDIHVADVADYPGRPDLHEKVRKHSEGVLQALLADLAAQRPDHVVLSGDITLTSLPSEFARARAHLDRNLAGVRVSAIPGNHDVWTDAAVQDRLFERRFGDLARCDLGASSWPRVHLLPGVALVLLDSSPHVQGADPARVKGHVSREQLERLERIAADPRVGSRFLVIVLHHHLRLSHEDAAREDPKDPTPLDNGAEVEAVLARLRVGMVLHGHRHKAMRLDLDLGGRRVPVLCPGSGTRVHALPDRTGRYGLYRIEEGRLAAAAIRRFDAGSGSFRDD